MQGRKRVSHDGCSFEDVVPQREAGGGFRGHDTANKASYANSPRARRTGAEFLGPFPCFIQFHPTTVRQRSLEQ